MKKLLLCIALANVSNLVLCTTSQEQTESRKTSIRSPAPASGNTPALVNSLQQSGLDGTGKEQSLQQAYARQPTASYSAVSTPQGTIYTQVQGSPINGQPTQPTNHGSYLITVNTNGQAQHHVPTYMPVAYTTNAAGTTPVIMQYLPHNAQSAGIQYLQLIPTRPLIVPINPYSSPYASPYNQYNPQQVPAHYHPTASQYTAQPSQYSTNPYSSQPHPSQYTAAQSPSSPYSSASQPSTHTLATAASTYATIPSSSASGYHHPTTNHNYAAYQPTLQSPIGGYSTNVFSYYRPNGLQMINNPLELSLNTNEYMPLQGESGYRMRRP